MSFASNKANSAKRADNGTAAPPPRCSRHAQCGSSGHLTSFIDSNKETRTRDRASERASEGSQSWLEIPDVSRDISQKRNSDSIRHIIQNFRFELNIATKISVSRSVK